MTSSENSRKLADLTKKRRELGDKLAQMPSMKKNYYYQKDWVKDNNRLINELRLVNNEIQILTVKVQQEVAEEIAKKRRVW